MCVLAEAFSFGSRLPEVRLVYYSVSYVGASVVPCATRNRSRHELFYNWEWSFPSRLMFVGGTVSIIRTRSRCTLWVGGKVREFFVRSWCSLLRRQQRQHGRCNHRTNASYY